MKIQSISSIAIRHPAATAVFERHSIDYSEVGETLAGASARLGLDVDAVAQELVMDVYAARILAPGTNTQEMLAYLDAMTEARLAQLSRDP